MVTIIQLFIINVIALIIIQLTNQMATNTINLIVQCAIEPASLLNPISPTIL